MNFSKIQDDYEHGFQRSAEIFFQNLKKDSQSIKTDYVYSDLVVYENLLNLDLMVSSIKRKPMIGVFWIFGSFLCFHFVHPFATVLPAWLASGAFISYYAGMKYSSKVCYKLEIVENDRSQIKIHLLQGKKQVICKIEDIALNDIQPLQQGSDEKGHIVTFDADSIDGESFNNLRLLFEANACYIDNPDFLKSILIGKKEDIDKFKYDQLKQQKIKQQDEDEEKALEEKIQEELNRINKEKK